MKSIAQTTLVWLARILAVWFCWFHFFGAFFIRGKGAESLTAQLLLSLAMIVLAVATPYLLRFAPMRVACLIAAASITVVCLERLFMLATFYQGADWKAISWVSAELLVVAIMGAYCYRKSMLRPLDY